MKRTFRLTRAADFERVRRAGKSTAHPLLVLAVHANGEAHTRVGITASRALGGAVQRNRAKRLLRAAIQPLLAQLPSGYDLVLVARQPLLAEKTPAVQTALEYCLRRAGLMDNE